MSEDQHIEDTQTEEAQADKLPTANWQDDELLTIAEAAAKIGVTERAVRRRLARPEYAAETRRTRTGTRTAAGLPPRLVETLAAEFQDANFQSEAAFDSHRQVDNFQGKSNTVESSNQKIEERGGDSAERGER